MVPCRFVCVVILLALVAAVFSQSYPRFEFTGTVLTNNSYIPRGLIGIGPNSSLNCMTDNSDCCNNGEGNWYNYTGSVVQQGTNGDSDLYVTRGDEVVYLNRITGGSTGMWRCDIPDSTGTQQSIYIYLGTLGDKMQGRLTSSVISFTLDTEPNEDPPEFTLTCRSEGGPATTVEWRRNEELVQEDSNHMTSQIIVDPSRNAVYNNTLRVRGREEGRYKCNVSNNLQDFIANTPPSVNISTFLLYPSSPPTQFNATYWSNTSIVLEWTYDIPISTGYNYVVYYQQAQSEGGSHFNVSFNINKNADNMYKYSLIGVVINIYGISIVATRALSPSLPSPMVGPIIPTVEAPSVTLTEDGSRVAGNVYTLTCRVTVPKEVQPDHPPTIKWQTPQSTSYTEAVSTTSGCSCISTITLNPLQETDEGDYVCMASYIVSVFQSPTVMATISVTVLPALPAPTVSVRAEGSAVAGSNDYTLVCDITVPAPASDDTPTVTVEWTFPSGDNVYAQSHTTGHHNYSSRLPLTPLAHDKQGDYTCNALYMVDGATSPTASKTYHVAVGVGHHDVSVEVEESGSRIVGSLYTLTCTVTLSDRPASGSSVSIQWQGPAGLSHSDDDDTTDNRVVVSQLALDPLTLAHGGDYICTALYTVNGETTTESGIETLIVIIPDPSVMLSVRDDIILVGKDTQIYCEIDLIGVILGSDVAINVTWFRDNITLTNSTISGLTTGATDVHSTLTFNSVHLSDMAIYGCYVTLTPLLGSASPVTASDILLLAVAEPVNPVRPGQVMVRNIKADSAIIQWTVVYISYSPETYIVQYGTSEDSLNQNSSAKYSGNDITITSKTYTIELSGLRGNTIYYVQVVATNTAKRSNTSIVRNFTTLSPMAMETEDESGQDEAGSPVGVVAACVTVVIFLTAIMAVSVFILLWCKCKHSGQKKYAFAEGKLATSTPGGPVNRERDSGKAEEIEIASVAPKEEDAVETQDDVTLEETDDYFQDPTAIMPAIEPISIERFPDYVRDMLQNKESKLKTEFMTLTKLPQPPSTIAILPHNKEQNRFNNIYPYDKSRVCLTEAPGVKNSDYINASFIDGYGGRKNAYIATQGPVEASVERFWRMVWEYKLQTIVMLTQCTEAGKIKCVCYWPEKLHDSVTVDEKFRVTYSSNIPFAEYEFRKFKLENLTEPDSKYMTVHHLHYTAWPDHGVPENVMSLIAFIRHLRKLHPISQPQPLLVHCSAGVGRTGTLILLDIVMQQMKAEGCIGVHHWLRMMRMQRMKMVQSQQQYEFIHCGLSEFVVCGETEVAAANLRIATKNLKKTADHGMTGFQKQLQIIDEVSSHYTVSYADAKQEYNKTKNRFPDKLPNDMYRVRLRCGPQPGSDYINASFISGYKQKRAYIAAQCPLKSTVADFWRMVNEFQCGCVIILCELEEEGQESSYRFWPKEEGDSEVHGKLTVNLQSVKTLGDIVTRHLNMVEGSAALNQAKRVTMLQLTSWPMKGLPHTSAVLSLIEKLTAAQMKSSNKRIIVMCSDGMSRTGTFLTIHSQIERVKTEGVVDFLQAIKSARLQRAGLVLNADHYAFCHEVLNTFLDNFDTYANFVEFKEVI